SFFSIFGSTFGSITGGGSSTAVAVAVTVTGCCATTSTGGGGGGGGAVMTTIFSSMTGALGVSTLGACNLAAISGWSLRISSSRNSAVILSRELEATLAAVMPKALALEMMSLFSKPSFLAMS